MGLHRRHRRPDQEGSCIIPEPAQSGIAFVRVGHVANKNAGDPTKWTYEAATDASVARRRGWSVASLRLTPQATPRNKFNIYWDEQKPCTGATYSRTMTGAGTSRRKAGSSTADRRQQPRRPPPTRIGSSACSSSRGTSPVTNRVLLTAGFGDYLTRWGGDEMPGNPTRSLVRVTEQCAPRVPTTAASPTSRIGPRTGRRTGWDSTTGTRR